MKKPTQRGDRHGVGQHEAQGSALEYHYQPAGIGKRNPRASDRSYSTFEMGTVATAGIARLDTACGGGRETVTKGLGGPGGLPEPWLARHAWALWPKVALFWANVDVAPSPA